MKRLLIFALALMLPAALAAVPALAELPAAATPEPGLAEAAGSIPESAEPFTWGYLATIAGAAAFTLLVVQFLKAPLDRIWKLPTRAFAYAVALAAMLTGTAFTTGLSPETALLAAVNAFLAALTAYGAYEVTFARGERRGD